MRVLHVTDYLPGTHARVGGAEFAALRTIEEQHARGVALTVATLRPDRSPQCYPWSFGAQLNNLDRYAPRAAYAVKQLFHPGDFISAHGMRRFLARERPDVIHFHNLHFAGLSPIKEARRAGLPAVLTVYDYWLWCPSFMLLRSDHALCREGHSGACVDCIGTRRMRWLRPMKQVAFARRPAVFGAFADAIDRFITLSHASADLLVHLGIPRNRVTTIPQPVWREAIAAGPPAPARPGRLVYVGWIEQRKGLHVVIDALARAAAEHPQLELDVYGMAANAAYETVLQQRITALGLGTRVRFLGKQSREVLLQALRDAFLVVVPEQWENMSPVILTEAMAAGACVLASRVGGIPEFVVDGESGLLADRDSADSFAARMDDAMKNPAWVERMRHAARARALRMFAPDDVHARHMETYRDVIAHHAL
ncbi:MAG: glycosyltransferase [Gammaproteobacteria bacterium]